MCENSELFNVAVFGLFKDDVKTLAIDVGYINDDLYQLLFAIINDIERQINGLINSLRNS